MAVKVADPAVEMGLIQPEVLEQRAVTPIPLLVAVAVLQEELCANRPDAGGLLGVAVAVAVEQVAAAVLAVLETQVQMQTLPHTVAFL